MQYAVADLGHRDAWSQEIVWLDDHVGVVLCDGKVIAAVVPLQMLRKLRATQSGGGGGGGADVLAAQYEGTNPFAEDFSDAFDTVLSSLRPDLVPILAAARAHAD